MKTTVFRKVSVEDRLPEKSGTYFTDEGELLYSNVSQKWSYIVVVYQAWPEWYLEEIDLPSEEELRKESLGKYTEDQAADEELKDFIEDDAATFMKGANYILNHINSKIKE